METGPSSGMTDLRRARISRARVRCGCGWAGVRSGTRKSGRWAFGRLLVGVESDSLRSDGRAGWMWALRAWNIDLEEVVGGQVGCARPASSCVLFVGTDALRTAAEMMSLGVHMSSLYGVTPWASRRTSERRWERTRGVPDVITPTRCSPWSTPLPTFPSSAPDAFRGSVDGTVENPAPHRHRSAECGAARRRRTSPQLTWPNWAGSLKA